MTRIVISHFGSNDVRYEAYIGEKQNDEIAVFGNFVKDIPDAIALAFRLLRFTQHPVKVAPPMRTPPPPEPKPVFPRCLTTDESHRLVGSRMAAKITIVQLSKTLHLRHETITQYERGLKPIPENIYKTMLGLYTPTEEATNAD